MLQIPLAQRLRRDTDLAAIVTIDLPLRRYSSTASRLNCGGYGRRPLLLPATMDILRPGPDGPSAQVSVKPGVLHISSTERYVDASRYDFSRCVALNRLPVGHESLKSLLACRRSSAGRVPRHG